MGWEGYGWLLIPPQTLIFVHGLVNEPVLLCVCVCQPCLLHWSCVNHGLPSSVHVCGYTFPSTVSH